MDAGWHARLSDLAQGQVRTYRTADFAEINSEYCETPVTPAYPTPRQPSRPSGVSPQRLVGRCLYQPPALRAEGFNFSNFAPSDR